MTQSSKKGTVHLVGLNGIRAIAVLGVIIYHFNPAFDLPETKIGPSGVTLFFTLSGFLITYLLIIERERSGTINIKKFYYRRVLRIWPLYFLFISLVLLLFPYEGSSLFYYVFFAGNVAFAAHVIYPMLGHYWSLAVEEQFYVIWPWLLKKPKSPLWALLIFFILYFGLKLGVNILVGGESHLYEFLYLSKFDCMALGGIAAYFYHYNREKIQWLGAWYFQLAAWGLLIVVALNRFHLFSIIDPYFVAIVPIILILAHNTNHKPLVPLTNNIVDFIGEISFGLYVYHQFTLHYTLLGMKHIALEGPAFTIVGYILAVGASILISYASFRLIEKPFLKLKHRYAVVKSSSKNEEAS